MGMLGRMAETLYGRAHFMVMMGDKPAMEILLHDRSITVEIKNPVLAVEFGLQEMLKHKKLDSVIIDKIKELGYTVKIKYKFLELDL